jgi:hypothetical protein
MVESCRGRLLLLAVGVALALAAPGSALGGGHDRIDIRPLGELHAEDIRRVELGR